MADDALVEFCRTQYPRLVGMLGLYCGDRAVAEELAQETLARVWRKWPKVHHLDRPDAWAQRVAVNLANSHFRRLLAERRARSRSGPVGEERPAPVEDVVTVRRAVAALPRRQRAAVVLHYFLDLPLAEVAERMETSVPAVKALLHRAVRRLRNEGGVVDTKEVPDVT
ncbi:MAG TPA: sigma-70 family RNA polymerase sigma factor [Actinomycetota bacterium]|nr:sigma-70 family RNA polymerase sigma factor [Actinomycetota bacterium]